MMSRPIQSRDCRQHSISSITSPPAPPGSTPTTQTRISRRPASLRSFTSSIDTLVADESYRGFASEDEYLKALREWIESKTYYEADIQIRGWYGTKTKQDYLNEPSIFEERRARKKAEKREKERQRQRAAVDKLSALPENDETPSSMEQQHGGPSGGVGETEAEPEGDASVEGTRRGGGLSRLRRVFSSGKRDRRPNDLGLPFAIKV